MSKHPTIATVTLNPAIDQTVQIPDFAAGDVNRIAEQQLDAGGKGVNVASFLSHMGHTIAATGILGADNAGLFEQLFVRQAIADHFVRLPGLTRVNMKIVDGVKLEITDINAPGLANSQAALAELEAQIEALCAAGVETFVLAGSLPADLPATIYRDLTEHLKAKGKKVALDASGPSFAAALEAGPDIIKPNISELAELVGRPLSSPQEVVAAAREATAGKVELIAVSMGEQGAIFINKDEVLLAQPPKANVKSTVGAGDAMVSGIIDARSKGLSLADLGRLATGFSLGALGEIGPHLPPRDTIEAFATQVTIEPLDF
ncbi:1-phosphofructokinase [Cohaesibacter intestini]|uniref:1-phosphofructokinase n=1 Tax=Cohaesibacter intestini TaxID=2211145 RepID=UPI000DEACA57|nr:1-phosphofructokinase [Cohaesibacter intestini]